MKQLRLILGLALIPLCALLGSGIIIGLVLGVALSYLFLTYGPGRKTSPFPTSYYLNHQHEVNGGLNEQAIVNATLRAREAARPTLEGPYPRQ